MYRNKHINFWHKWKKIDIYTVLCVQYHQIFHFEWKILASEQARAIHWKLKIKERSTSEKNINIWSLWLKQNT